MLNNPQGGIGYAAEFQSSALPWVTSSIAPAAGSPVRFDFPKVTRFIIVSNRDTTATNTISVGFTRAGVVSTSNKYILNGGQSMTFEVRVKELWLQGETGTPPISICAGLTNIDKNAMPLLTGTLPDGSPGWTGVG
jgi:hypothetical protein